MEEIMTKEEMIIEEFYVNRKDEYDKDTSKIIMKDLKETFGKPYRKKTSEDTIYLFDFGCGGVGIFHNGERITSTFEFEDYERTKYEVKNYDRLKVVYEMM